MSFFVGIDKSEVICKGSGEVPEEFTPYVFIHETDGEYCAAVGFYEPRYNGGKGGVFDGIGGHMDWEYVIAWKRLREDDLFVSKNPTRKPGEE